MDYCYINKNAQNGENDFYVKLIWQVDEDQRYTVTHAHNGEDVTVAIRTTDGGGEINISGREYVLTENTLLIAKRKDIIKYRTVQKRWRFYWFEFTVIRGNIPAILFKNIDFNQGENCITDEIIHAFSSENQKLIQSGFNFLVNRWLTDDLMDQREAIALQVARYIDLSPIDAVYSFDFLLERFNVSERTLRKNFFESFAMTPKEYISRRKEETVKILIKTTQMKIKDIAGKTGFQNEYYFSRWFKSRFGCPPVEYRKNH